MKKKRSNKLLRIIIIIIFVLNSILGYGFVNITILKIPLNEIFLIFAMLISMPEIFVTVKKYNFIKIILTWFFLFFPFVIIGYIENGIFAFRDATHLLEVWWIILAIIAFKEINIEELQKGLYCIIYLYIIRTVTDFLPLSNTLVIKGLHGDLDLLKKSNSMVIISVISFWSYVLKMHKYFIVIVLFVISILTNQSRTEIFAILLMSILYLMIQRFKMEIFRKLVLLISILLVSYSIIINIDFIGEYTKFGKLLTFEEYYELLLSASGESKTFEGSADGVNKRVEWRDEIFRKAANSLKVLLLGQGFGIPLTDFFLKDNVIVREPHNSFLSIFARTGIIGFCICLLFHAKLGISIVKELRKAYGTNNKSYFILALFCCFLAIIDVYAGAMTQPGFENPNTAIPAFILIGLSIVLEENVKKINKYGSSQNFDNKSFI